MTKILTPDAQSDRNDFERRYGYDGNCSCHLSAPCGSCTHHGNPLNQEEDDECWMDDPDAQPTGYAPKLIGCTPEEAAGLNLKCYALVHFDDELDLIVEFEHLIGILPEHAGRYVVEHVLMTEEHFNLVPEFQG